MYNVYAKLDQMLFTKSNLLVPVEYFRILPLVPEVQLFPMDQGFPFLLSRREFRVSRMALVIQELLHSPFHPGVPCFL